MLFYLMEATEIKDKILEYPDTTVKLGGLFYENGKFIIKYEIKRKRKDA